MTPLELLAVGVIVVAVWSAGWIARDNQNAAVTWLPLALGLVMFASGLVWIIVLGLKEATK